MVEIVNGLSIDEVMSGGALFVLKHEPSGKPDDKEEDDEYVDAIGGHLKMECLDFGNSDENLEPFENIAKKMKNVILDGKIKKRVLREGYGGIPEPSSQVELHYNAYVQFEAQPFDSTYARRKRFSFIVGQGQVIEGLEIAVQSMKLNEKAQFLIHPDFAYRGSGFKRIPPNSDVLFEIELFDVKEPIEDNVSKRETRDFHYMYPHCMGLCLRGKNRFRLKDYQGAIQEYNSAIHKMEEAILKDYEDQLKYDELLVRLHTNLLVCYTLLKLPKRGCIHAQQIYKMAKNEAFKVQAKVFFNHSRCLKMLGDFQQAESKLIRARNLAPNNREILEEYLALNKAKEAFRKQQCTLAKAFLQPTLH